jgi:hypothetical protein
MAEQYLALLQCAVANPAQTLSDMLTSCGITRRSATLGQPKDPVPQPAGLDSRKAQLSNRRATLSPAQQALLEKRLRGEPHG